MQRDLIIQNVDKLLGVLEARARDHKRTIMVGRTHGVHAEPMTFGMKLALWYAEMKRNRTRLVAARDAVAVGKLSGAVGTFAHLPPEIEERLCEKLGLSPAPSRLKCCSATATRSAIRARHPREHPRQNRGRDPKPAANGNSRSRRVLL